MCFKHKSCITEYMIDKAKNIRLAVIAIGIGTKYSQ